MPQNLGFPLLGGLSFPIWEVGRWAGRVASERTWKLQQRLLLHSWLVLLTSCLGEPLPGAGRRCLNQPFLGLLPLDLLSRIPPTNLLWLSPFIPASHIRGSRFAEDTRLLGSGQL